jgi:hypothetical protein
MSKTLAAMIVLTLTSPAFAQAPCPYVDDKGDQIVFVDDGENTVTVTLAGKAAEDCGWALLADGPNAGSMAIGCDGGPTGPFGFGGKTLDSSKRDLMVFQNALWYRVCR